LKKKPQTRLLQSNKGKGRGLAPHQKNRRTEVNFEETRKGERLVRKKKGDKVPRQVTASTMENAVSLRGEDPGEKNAGRSDHPNALNGPVKRITGGKKGSGNKDRELIAKKVNQGLIIEGTGTGRSARSFNIAAAEKTIFSPA